MASKESLTENEKSEIEALLYMLYAKLNGHLKSITIQDKRGFINFGRQRDKITVDFAKSVDSHVIINKDILNTLSEKNSVRFYFYMSVYLNIYDIIFNLLFNFSSGARKVG
jgi:hypothetical protein